MMRVYEAVTAMGSLKFSRERIWLPSSLHFKEWKSLIESPGNELMVDCLKFRFSAGYDGPVATPATGNHLTAHRHQCNVATYTIAKVREGAMMGPFDALPST